MSVSGDYIVIEGNIGAGKTTLSTLLSERWETRLLLEQFSDNPFLPGFYEDPSKYSFPLELSFLAERYQQMKSIFASPDLFKPAVVADYFIHKSRIFASYTLPELEFSLFCKLFEIIENALPKPDILLYLFSDVSRLQENIRKRGRPYEQKISDTYLDQIQQAYIRHLKTIVDFPVIMVDVSDKDFVNQPEYLNSLEKILQDKHLSGFRVREI